MLRKFITARVYWLSRAFFTLRKTRLSPMHCYPFSSRLVLNLTLALSWVSMGHLVKLCYKGTILVLHLAVHELLFGGRNRKKTEQARTNNLLQYNPVLYHWAISSYTNVVYNTLHEWWLLWEESLQVVFSLKTSWKWEYIFFIYTVFSNIRMCDNFCSCFRANVGLHGRDRITL